MSEDEGQGLSENWATLWEAFADAQPEQTAVVIWRDSQTWRELDDRAARLATALADRGTGVGTRIAQLMYNCPEYLESAYAHVRAHGGVCIADEVQVGFGRLGSSYWGFEGQRVTPDIVVLGKPIGNGFPLAAVITTREIADAFDNGMEYFATFGGNPVACAAGLAVMDVIEQHDLQARALAHGRYLLGALREIQQRHAFIGDVRGRGLFLGVEIVADAAARTPAPALAGYLVNRLREEHILAGTDGPDHNVIKIRPTMVVERHDLERFVDVFARLCGAPACRALLAEPS